MLRFHASLSRILSRRLSSQLHHDAEKTREEILSLIAHHVTAVNYIYRDTRFDGRIEHRNIKFEVQRIKVRDVASRLKMLPTSKMRSMTSIELSELVINPPESA